VDNNSIKILIVGAGQIGSRHLQGAIKNKKQVLITVVDIHPSALKLSESIVDKKTIGNLYSSVIYKKELPKNENFDICIISTNADIRANITLDLLTNCNFKYIVFEKILFQKEQDFEIISKILNKKNISAWVNCPRRTYPIYQKIKEIIDLNLPVEMEISGSSWGMACNAIHFIDLFSYLVDDSSLKIVDVNFSDSILKSKRGENFYEVNGSIKCVIGKHSLLMSCEENKDITLNIKIKNGNINNSIDEIKEIWIHNTNGLTNSKRINIPYQSDLTGKLIDSIINKNCRLASYEDSNKHHIPLLVAIREHLSKILNKKLSECPIT
jgi:hypothetical protein